MTTHDDCVSVLHHLDLRSKFELINETTTTASWNTIANEEVCPTRSGLVFFSAEIQKMRDAVLVGSISAINIPQRQEIGTHSLSVSGLHKRTIVELFVYLLCYEARRST